MTGWDWINMSLCHICGCKYDWEMFYNNHMRSVHHVKVNRKLGVPLTKEHRLFLTDYFENVCSCPTLEKIKELSTILDIKKENVYWWFFNQRRKNKLCKVGNSRK